MNDELSPYDRHKYGVPAGGRWFHRKHPMLTLVTNEDQFLVAWDISHKSDSKCFGIYPSFADFWSNYLDVAPSKRWGYELVRKDKPAKIYFDIEYWTADEDIGHTKLLMFLDHIRKRLGEHSPVSPEIYYVTGTRPDKGMFKNSYHVVVDNFVCMNNHDEGSMLELVIETIELGDAWKTTKPNGKVVDIVDASVYKKDQCIRLPLSAKRSNKTPRPFHILSEDGYEQDDFREPEDAYDIYDAEHFCITNPDYNGDRIMFRTELVKTASKYTKAKKTSDRQPRQLMTQAQTKQATQEAVIPTEEYPFLIEDIHSLLATCGDTVSRVYSVTKTDPERDEYTVKCNQRKQRRPCLHNPSVLHDSNTMWLYAIRDADRFRLEYHCFGSACSELRNKTIGHVQALSAPPVPSPEQVTDDHMLEEMICMMNTLDNDQPMETEQPAGTEHTDTQTPMDLDQAPTHGPFTRTPNECYSEPLVRNLPTDQRVIAIAAPCGTGKTKAFVSFIENMSSKTKLTIVYVSHRKALTEKAMATLPQINGTAWTSYKDTKTEINLRETPLVIVQYEALGRIQGYDTNHGHDNKLILVLDEFNSICHQMHSNCGNPVLAQQVFFDLMQESSCVVAMDGYLDQHRLDILEKYTEQPAYLIHNEYQSRSTHTVQHTRDVAKTVKFILQVLAEGRRIICPCMSKNQAEEIYAQATARFASTKSVLLYTCDNPWKGEDVNVVWATVDLLIHTSTIDCGISFEVSNHFDTCVCLFDNSIGPNHETALQMLSRSRDTREFLICTTQKRFKQQNTDPNQVLAEMDARIARVSDSYFFGIRYSHAHRSRSWASCNPYLAAYVMSKVINRRTRNHMAREVLDMLQRDGAQVMARQMDFSAYLQPPPQDPGAFPFMEPPPTPRSSEIPGRSPEERVAKLQKEYGFDGFNPEDLEALKRYERADVLAAFRNLTMLAKNGTSFTPALRQKRRDVAKARAGHEYCRQSQSFNMAIISRSEVLAGVEGGCYDYDANKAASKITQFFTGVADPFAIPSLTQDQLEARLQCSMIRTTKRRKLAQPEAEPEKEKESLCLSIAKKTEFLALYHEWIQCNPGLHAPFRIPGNEPITFIRAMHLFSHTLAVMYSMEYRRDKKHTKVEGQRVFTYSSYNLDDFARQGKGVAIDATKPPIPPWAEQPLEELAETEILQCDGRIIQPGLGFARRQAVDFCSHDLPGIKDDRPMTREEWESTELRRKEKMSVKLFFEK